MSNGALSARRGKQFEIWLEQLLRASGIAGVERNIKYRSPTGASRQVDLAFQWRTAGRTRLCLVEAKYTATGRVDGQYHGEPVIKLRREGVSRHYLDSLIDELRERQRFVNADATYLMTNAYFDEKTRHDAKRCHIAVYERDALTRLYRRAGGRLETIDDSILRIDTRQYRHEPRIIALPDVGPTTTRQYMAPRHP